jgi:transposase InsO family protein
VLLTSVLHVPTLGINLMSTPQITSKKGSCWEGEHFANVYDRHGKVILLGHKLDGMYRIDCNLPAVSGASVNASVGADVWHKRFGHIGYKSLRDMTRNKSVRGLGALCVPDKPQVCDVCDKAKLKRAHFAPSSSRAKLPLELVHSDTMGPMPERGLEDELYVVTALDDFSGYAEVLLVRSKDEAAPALINLIVRWQRQIGAKVKILRTDQGTEFKGDLARYCKRKGITRQTSVVYTPEQNGRAERLNCTLMDRVRALLLEYNMPKVVWSEAMHTAAYLRNRTASSLNKTPHELFYREEPDVSHLRTFGCKAFVYVEKHERDKLEARAQEHAMVGYASNSKAYRLLRLGTNGDLCVIEAVSVHFHEDSRPSFLDNHSDNLASAPQLMGGGGAYAPQNLALDSSYHASQSEGATDGGHTSASAAPGQPSTDEDTDPAAAGTGDNDSEMGG